MLKTNEVGRDGRSQSTIQRIAKAHELLDKTIENLIDKVGFGAARVEVIIRDNQVDLVSVEQKSSHK